MQYLVLDRIGSNAGAKTQRVICLAAVLAFTSTAVLGEGSIDHDTVFPGHDCYRVVTAPMIPGSARPAPTGCSDTEVIDVLWIYTAGAMAVVDQDVQQLFAACEFAIADANITFANTGLPFSVRIVGFASTEYDESGDHLGLIQGTSDGVMDEVHALRDLVAADIVALVTQTGFCGQAYVAPNNAAYGFQMDTAGCLINFNPFRHELGHNLGSQHYVTDTYGYFSYSSGHRLTIGTTELGTAMAGNDIPHYSNPDVLFLGQPTGVPIGPDEEADNFTAFTQTVPLVASFRCSDVVCPGDLTGDRVVDVADLLGLIGSWGFCGACPADLDGDGNVGIVDFLGLLANWGPCP